MHFNINYYLILNWPKYWIKSKNIYILQVYFLVCCIYSNALQTRFYYGSKHYELWSDCSSWSIHIPTKFHENILNDPRVIDDTRIVIDGWTDLPMFQRCIVMRRFNISYKQVKMTYSLPRVYAVFCGRFITSVYWDYLYAPKQGKLASVCLQWFSSPYSCVMW